MSLVISRSFFHSPSLLHPTLPFVLLLHGSSLALISYSSTLGGFGFEMVKSKQQSNNRQYKAPIFIISSSYLMPTSLIPDLNLLGANIGK